MLGIFSVFLTLLISLLGCACCCCFFWIYPLISFIFGACCCKSNSETTIQQVHQTNVYSSELQTQTVALAENVEVPVAEAYLTPPISEAHAVGYSTLPDGSRNLSERTEDLPKQEFKDVWASVLFGINVLVVIAFASSAGSGSGSELPFTDSSVNMNSILFFGVGSTFLVLFISSLLLSVLINNSENIIHISMMLSILAAGISAVLSLAAGQFLTFFLLLLLTGLNVWYYYAVQDRIPFASAILSTACTAIQQNFPALMCLCMIGVVMQVIWLMLWGAAATSIYNTYMIDHTSTPVMGAVTASTAAPTTASTSTTHTMDLDKLEHETSNFGMVFLLALSAFWGIEVIKYVLVATSQGTVASWWFQPKHPSPVRASLLRAITFSFGSVCFGALILALIEATRLIVRALKNALESQDRDTDTTNSNRRDTEEEDDGDSAERAREAAAMRAMAECLLLLLDWVLEQIENLVIYVNRYAFGYVAAYGYGYREAGKQVNDLFIRRGWIGIINDNLISNAMSFLLLFIAISSAVCCGIVGMIANPFGNSSPGLTGAFIGLLAGFLVGSILVTCLLDSAVAMVFICFAEDPRMLEKHHPTTYASLYYAWDQFHGGSLVWLNASPSSTSATTTTTGPSTGYGYGYGRPTPTTTTSTTSTTALSSYGSTSTSTAGYGGTKHEYPPPPPTSTGGMAPLSRYGSSGTGNTGTSGTGTSGNTGSTIPVAAYYPPTTAPTYARPAPPAQYTAYDDYEGYGYEGVAYQQQGSGQGSGGGGYYPTAMSGHDHCHGHHAYYQPTATGTTGTATGATGSGYQYYATTTGGQPYYPQPPNPHPHARPAPSPFYRNVSDVPPPYNPNFYRDA